MVMGWWSNRNKCCNMVLWKHIPYALSLAYIAIIPKISHIFIQGMLCKYKSCYFVFILFIGLQIMLNFSAGILEKNVYSFHTELKENIWLTFQALTIHEFNCFWDSSQEDDDIQIMLFPCCDIYYSINFLMLSSPMGRRSKKSLNYFLFHIELLWVILENKF